MGTFGLDIRKFADRLLEFVEKVVISSTQDVVEEMVLPVAKGGKMRVKTGFLRASLVASTSYFPLIREDYRPPADAPDNSFDADLGPVALIIAGAKPDDTVNIGFTASYALPREFRDGFVRLAAQNWDAIVAKNAQAAEKILG